MTEKRITEIAKRQVSQMCSVHPAEIQELIEDGIKEALKEQLTIPVVSNNEMVDCKHNGVRRPDPLGGFFCVKCDTFVNKQTKL